MLQIALQRIPVSLIHTTAALLGFVVTMLQGPTVAIARWGMQEMDIIVVMILMLMGYLIIL